MDDEKFYEDELREVIDSASDERRIARYLAKNPKLVLYTFNTGNNTHLIRHEFPFGNKFRADFCVVSGHSGGWEVHLIELEPVGQRLFLRSGEDSQALRKARFQIESWHKWIKDNPQAFRVQLAEDARSGKLHDPDFDPEDGDHYRNRILDPDYSFKVDYHIVIGRRDSLKGDDKRRRSYYHDFNQCSIVTYDRFLKTARSFDDYLRYRKELERRCSQT